MFRNQGETKIGQRVVETENPRLVVNRGRDRGVGERTWGATDRREEAPRRRVCPTGARPRPVRVAGLCMLHRPQARQCPRGFPLGSLPSTGRTPQTEGGQEGGVVWRGGNLGGNRPAGSANLSGCDADQRNRLRCEATKSGGLLRRGPGGGGHRWGGEPPPHSHRSRDGARHACGGGEAPASPRRHGGRQPAGADEGVVAGADRRQGGTGEPTTRQHDGSARADAAADRRGGDAGAKGSLASRRRAAPSRV